MKIAILLSGQPRFVDSISFQTIKENLLDKYNCDVFCHTWWNPNGGKFKTAPWSGLGDIQIEKNALHDIRRLYKPVKLEWSQPLDRNFVKKIYERTSHISTPYNLTSMYLSLKKSYNLMREYMSTNDVVYDFVIRLRYDALLLKFPNLEKLDRNFLYAPDYSRYHNHIGNNCLIIPQWLSKPIMTIYDKIDELYDDGCLLNDEELLTTLIHKEKIPYHILPQNQFDIGLYRGK